MGELTPDLLRVFRELDTCAVSNAIEQFDVRLRNDGFADPSIKCIFPEGGAAIGQAITARIRSSTPPSVGHGYLDRTDWWTYIDSVPTPRFLVVEDVDERPGFGAFVGEIHANVFRALGCVAYATNGSVRDVEAVRKTGFQLFAGGIAVSHAFVHLIDFGTPVTVGGLTVNSGDIVFGDRHGVMTVPAPILREVPAVVARLAERERQVIELCQSPAFSIESLRLLVRQWK
jgi:4-hydroxy-4-methyl-2-oxoglutarate aldolase